MIGKYLVFKLTDSPLLGINMSFASRHGIETLTLHESSLELSVEETHPTNLSEEIEHYTLDKINTTTPTECGKIKKAINLQTGFMADSGTGPATINDLVSNGNTAHSTINTHSRKDDILKVSSSHIVNSSIFDGNILIEPILFSGTFNENALNRSNPHKTIEWIGFSNDSQYQGEWIIFKILNFIISTKNISYPCFENCKNTMYTNSSCATQKNEYVLLKHSNVFLGEVQLKELTTQSRIRAGTAFADNILVHDEASEWDALLKAGILKGQNLHACMQFEWSCNESKGYVPAYANIQELISNNVSNFRICILEPSSLSERQYYIVKPALNDSGYAFKQHVNSSREHPLHIKWLLKNARGSGFTVAFNAFGMPVGASADHVFMEFLNSIVKKDSYLQKTFKHCINMIKHEQGLTEYPLIQINISYGKQCRDS